MIWIIIEQKAHESVFFFCMVFTDENTPVIPGDAYLSLVYNKQHKIVL